MPRKELDNAVLEAVIKDLGGREVGEPKYHKSGPGSFKVEWKQYELPDGEELHVHYPNGYYGGTFMGENPSLIYSKSAAPEIEKKIAQKSKEVEIGKDYMFER